MSAGIEVKLPPFEAPRSPRKDSRRHLRGADGPHWTPTELYRRNEALRKTLGMEGTKASTPEYAEGFDGIEWNTEAVVCPRTVERVNAGRLRYRYPDSYGEVKR